MMDCEMRPCMRALVKTDLKRIYCSLMSFLFLAQPVYRYIPIPPRFTCIYRNMTRSNISQRYPWLVTVPILFLLKICKKRDKKGNIYCQWRQAYSPAVRAQEVLS